MADVVALENWVLQTSFLLQRSYIRSPLARVERYRNLVRIGLKLEYLGESMNFKGLRYLKNSILRDVKSQTLKKNTV